MNIDSRNNILVIYSDSGIIHLAAMISRITAIRPTGSGSGFIVERHADSAVIIDCENAVGRDIAMAKCLEAWIAWQGHVMLMAAGGK